MLTYTHKVNKRFVQYVILTSSTHCMCCSLLAITRAVSPDEFTTEQLEQWKGQNQGRLIHFFHSTFIHLSIHSWICAYVIILYLCVKQLLLWAEVSNTLFCCIMHSNEVLCCLLRSSFPGSHWETHTNTHTQSGQLMAILLGADRFVTTVDFSHQFWARKSTRAREVFSDIRTAKWRPVSFRSCLTQKRAR